MKKIFLLVLALLIAFSIVGCVKNKNKKQDSGPVQVKTDGFDENMEVDWK